MLRPQLLKWHFWNRLVVIMIIKIAQLWNWPPQSWFLTLHQLLWLRKRPSSERRSSVDDFAKIRSTFAQNRNLHSSFAPSPIMDKNWQSGVGSNPSCFSSCPMIICMMDVCGRSYYAIFRHQYSNQIWNGSDSTLKTSLISLFDDSDNYWSTLYIFHWLCSSFMPLKN